jgi:hypothetical protein
MEVHAVTSSERVELITSSLEHLSQWVAFADADDANAYVHFREAAGAARGELVMEVASGLGGDSSVGGLFGDPQAVELLGEMGLLQVAGENFQRAGVHRQPVPLADQVEWIFEAVFHRPPEFSLAVNAGSG